MKIVLASSSPRRLELLGQLGLEVEVVPPMSDETPGKNEKPSALVTRLARTKAESALNQLGGRLGTGIVVAADTIVVAPNGRQILNKPQDRAEAIKMLRSLSGKRHEVLTGYCLAPYGHAKPKKNKALVKVISSRVKMRKLSTSEITRYVDSGEPMDKAGAYGAQGKGMALIESIEGSYANVIGLPICQLLVDLKAMTGVELFAWTL